MLCEYKVLKLLFISYSIQNIFNMITNHEHNAWSNKLEFMKTNNKRGERSLLRNCISLFKEFIPEVLIKLTLYFIKIHSCLSLMMSIYKSIFIMFSYLLHLNIDSFPCIPVIHKINTLNNFYSKTTIPQEYFQWPGQEANSLVRQLFHKSILFQMN